jgi:tripartite ATP-independent transporter DctM subunit
MDEAGGGPGADTAMAGSKTRGVSWAAEPLAAVQRVLGTLCAILLAVLLALVLSSVALCYLFGIGFVGSDELAIWLHVALIACGAPLAIHGGLAMRLDFMVERLPARARRAAAIIADSLIVISALSLSLGGARIAAMVGGVSPTLGLPEWIRFGLLAGGGALTLLLVVLARLAAGQGRSLLAALAIGGLAYFGAGQFVLISGWPPSAIALLLALAGLLSGAPLPHAFLAAAYLAIPFGSSMPEPAAVASVVSGMSKFLLLGIPFFLLAGGLLAASGAAHRLVSFAAALVGHRRAGLAQTSLLTSVLFKGGYRPEQAGAIIAATSVLDNLIPPSIAFLILAAATNLSVGSLFLGGLGAGLVMAVALAVANYLTATEQSRQPRVTVAERWRRAGGALPAAGLGLIIVVGIRFGVVTITEAAALAALYTLALALSERLRFAPLHKAFRQAAVEASSIGLLIGSAAPLAFLLAVDNVGGGLAALVTGLGAEPLAVLLLANLVLLAVGLVLDVGAAILLIGPILVPIATAVGIDPILFGVVLVANLMIGALTPPVGILVYVVSGVTKVPPAALFRALLPYLAALLIALAVLGAIALVA